MKVSTQRLENVVPQQPAIFDSSHDLWGAKLDYWNARAHTDGAPSGKLGGSTTTKAFYIDIDLTNRREPQLVIVDNKAHFDWENAERRTLTPSDIDMVTTLLTKFVADSDAKRAASSNTAERHAIAARAGALRQLVAQVPELACSAEILKNLESQASQPAIEPGLVRQARALIGILNDPSTYQPVATSPVTGGVSLLARRLTGQWFF